MVRRGFLRKIVERILRQPHRWVFGHVIAVVGVGTGLVAFYHHTSASIQTGQIAREIQMEVIAERRPVRGVGTGAETNC